MARFKYATAAVIAYYCETRQLVFANTGQPPAPGGGTHLEMAA